jgi:hypothetical protein
VELVALRQELAKLGFIRNKPETLASSVAAVRNDIRPVRSMRSVAAGREDHPQRATRLSPVQRLAQVVKDFRRWLLARGQPVKTEPATTTETGKQIVKVEPTETVKQAEKISPETTQPPRQRPQIKLNQPPPRRSRGISH